MAINEITVRQQSGVFEVVNIVMQEREDTMKRLLVTLATLVLVVLSLPLVSFGLNLSALGTPTIDGIMSPGEWDNAAKLDFQANVPGGGTTPATFYVMNDGLNLYLALRLTRPSFGFKTEFIVDFDNNNKGIPQNGDDVLTMIAGKYVIPPVFSDSYLYTCYGNSPTCIIDDTLTTLGIQPAAKLPDGAGTERNDGTYTVVELWHPLCSLDTTHDFCLKPGDTVGFRITLRLYSTSVAYAATVIPDPTSGTTALASGTSGNYEQITIASPVVTRKIDIKPGSRENPINTKSEGKIPVAILSTRDWSAPANVDRDRRLLTFGHDGTEQSLAFCDEDAQDVNNDGLPDLVCHFSTQLTGFQVGDTVGILNGKDKDGGPDFTAKDSVRIVK